MIYFEIVFIEDICSILPKFWEIFGEYCEAIVRKYSYYYVGLMGYYGGIVGGGGCGG